MLFSALFAAFMGATAKILTAQLPVIEVVFFRSLFGTIFIAVSFFAISLKQKGGKPFLLLLRAFFGLLSMFLFFYNVSNISLAEAVIYSKLSPLFIVLFAFLFLNEKITKVLIFTIILGFIGMTLVMQPDNFSFEKSHIFGFLNAICAAIAFTSIKELKKYYDTRIIVLYFTLFGTIFPLIIMMISTYYEISSSLNFIFSKFVMPENIDWFYILGLGFSSALSQIYMTKAYGVTEASIASAMSYTVIIFSMIIGISLGDSLPNPLAIIGICLIVFSGIIVAKLKNSKKNDLKK